MGISRRTFMKGAALVSTSGLFLCSLDKLAYSAPTLRSLPSRTASENGAKPGFKVDGWDRHDQPVEHASMSGSNVDAAGAEVFIQVNRAWRTAWR
jgi:hypothetical protein